ncbi:MAG: hypoxanthine-guanine phosphoribosyltransferase [Gammaproteobacteria bacterium]|nr:hypoxanthine-guanine phosphoribosyltransferase [Gammaproteobacteria bacterium]MCY3687563.1 hypoxanthine-guanine phosphoribosyltransferase [Gammaproteobacteria bacterium]
MAAIASRAARIHDAVRVEAALDRMAREITAELAGSDPILLCVMNGGLIVTGLLAVRLQFPLQIDYLHMTRYRGATSGGEIECRVMPALDLRGRVVLVVDDILDEGNTLSAVLRYCREQGAARILSAVLVDKRRPRPEALAAADFSGLHVPDRYVYGYGMDYKNYLRNADGIYAVADEDM